MDGEGGSALETSSKLQFMMKIVKHLLKNLEKRFETDLPGHLQTSEVVYAAVHGWQTIP